MMVLLLLVVVVMVMVMMMVVTMMRMTGFIIMIMVVMVMFSGYENFVSRLDIGAGDDRLGWLGKLDAGTLKLKVAASIVAISSIHLLQKFVNIENTPDDKLMWYVIIHLTFVLSALLMGVLDRIAFAAHRDDGDDHKSH